MRYHMYVFFSKFPTRLTLFIAMFATSGEADESSASHAISSVPAAIMALFVIVFHFVLIYIFKKRFVPNFSKCDDVVEKLGRHSVPSWDSPALILDVIQRGLYGRASHICSGVLVWFTLIWVLHHLAKLQSQNFH